MGRRRHRLENMALRERRSRRATSTPHVQFVSLDGTKSAIEIAAVANAADLTFQTGSLSHPAASMICRRSCGWGAAGGGRRAGMVEVVSVAGRPPSAARPTLGRLRHSSRPRREYVLRCFAEYGLKHNVHVQALPPHRVELSLSIASTMARGGTNRRCMRLSRRRGGDGGSGILLQANERYGKLTPMPVACVARLAIGLRKAPASRTPVAAGQAARWDDCVVDYQSAAARYSAGHGARIPDGFRFFAPPASRTL